jgi:hypothetical protein
MSESRGGIMALNKNAKKWVKALRSRKYKQTTGRLVDLDKKRYCCLGVACELAVKAKVIPPVDKMYSTYDGELSSLPGVVREWLGLTDCDGSFFEEDKRSNLTELNDAHKKTFGQIARVIESKPEGLFE